MKVNNIRKYTLHIDNDDVKIKNNIDEYLNVVNTLDFLHATDSTVNNSAPMKKMSHWKDPLFDLENVTRRYIDLNIILEYSNRLFLFRNGLLIKNQIITKDNRNVKLIAMLGYSDD